MALQPRRMGQSPEKPKGYGTMKPPPHRRSHRLPPAPAVAQRAAWGEEEEEEEKLLAHVGSQFRLLVSALTCNLISMACSDRPTPA